MNETECEDLIKSVKWTEPSNLISLAILEFINVLVIGGNLLVIAAVFCSNKLRSVTNFFIVNLAVADLLVGLAVLPFSATWEVFKVWIFGDVWCRIWLAVDVWMCTASILNLCAISLDRYVAVTRPVTYPSIMSTKKAKSLIAGIWVLSFVICFPPLVGWKDQKPMAEPTYTRGNYTLYYATTSTTVSAEPLTAAVTISDTTSASPLSSSASSLSKTSSPSVTGYSSYSSEKRLKRKYRHKPMSAESELYLPPRIIRSSAQAKTMDDADSSTQLYSSFNPYDPYHAHLDVRKISRNVNNHKVRDAVTAFNENNDGDGYAEEDNALDIEEDSQYDEDSLSGYPMTASTSSGGLLEEYSKFDASGDDGDGSTNFYKDYETYRERLEELKAESKSHSGGGVRPTSRTTTNTPSDTTTSTRKRITPSYESSSAPPSIPSSQASSLPPPSSSSSSSALPQTPPPPCPWKCELTNDRGYVLYSALGSFYIPMFVMLFFYWRIYRAAVRTTRAINQGFKTTKGSKGIGSRFDEQRLTLRIHRGRGSNQHESTHSNGSTQSTTTTLGTPSPERMSKYSTRRMHNHDKIKISVSYPSNDNISEMAQHVHESNNSHSHNHHHHHPHHERGRTASASGSNMLFAVHYGSHNGRECTETQLYRHQHAGNCYLQVGKSMPDMMRRASNASDTSHQLMPTNRPNKKMGKRNIKAQVKRFRMETKAAKTLAIIVGLFIFCWLPFFTMYIIRPFCEDCIDPLLFSILFWLGYCNSAVNPMIYALFSKDFRFAFKRIICKCFCSSKSINLKTSRRGSDLSAIRIRGRTPSITPSAAAHSFGDESEYHPSEHSEHR
ncbi:octopamine receptor in mushroom bodies isoform X2 [Haematobia irritans]|uniref:octopamine receptor in mushroom bodies isoform X2 n=1 Tax=Haematobia irritans TaxID=7368 RepID=UPI003F4F5F7F